MSQNRRLIALATAMVISCMCLASCARSSESVSNEADSLESVTSSSIETDQDTEASSASEASSSRATESPQLVNSIGVKSSAASPTNKIEPAAATLKLNKTQITDDYELTLVAAGWQDEVHPNADANQTYMYFADEDKKSYFVIEFTYKNLGDSFYQMRSTPGGTTTEQSIKFNDKYTYSVDVYDPDVPSLFTSAVTSAIDPFDTKRFYMVASVADEIRENFKHADLTWQFKRIETSDGENYTVSPDLLGNYTAHFE